MITKHSKKRNAKSPSISRFIPDVAKALAGRPDRKKVFGVYSKALKTFTLLIFIVAIVILGYDLYVNIQDKKKIDLERAKITKEISFWESFLEKNNNYRDGYLQVAILEYKLRNLDRARLYLDNALKIDPNFEKAKELDKVLK